MKTISYKWFFVMMLIFIFVGCAETVPLHLGVQPERVSELESVIPESVVNLEKPLLPGLKALTINQAQYIEKFGEYQISPQAKYVISYDRYGNRTEESIYDGQGKLHKKQSYQYEYDLKGKIASKSFYGSSKVLVAKWVFKYNEQDRLDEWTKYDGTGNLAFKVIYKYDEAGRKVEEAEYGNRAEFIGWSNYQYDAQGNKIMVESSNLSDASSKKWVYQYDKENKKLIESRCSEEKALFSDFRKFVYKYEGDKTEESEYSSDRVLLRKIVRRDDEQGHRLETVWYNANDTLNRKWLYQYDEHGNKIEEALYGADGLLEQKSLWKYRYDEKGNKLQEMASRLEAKFGKHEEVPVSDTGYEYEFYQSDNEPTK
jgi:hypothetical protein